MKINLLFPAFNEQDNLEVLYDRLTHVIAKIKNHKFEIIFIDDCSSDETPNVIAQLNSENKNVKGIRFARNCGTHAAIAAGLNATMGECAIVMATDLQDPPELIEDLIKEWEKGSKIVWGVRSKREGESIFTKFFSRLYYILMNKLTVVSQPPTGADVFLADRAVIEAFKKFPEKHSSVFMALAWLGFPQSEIFYIKEKRHLGKSKWTLKKKIKLTLDSLLSFSDIPIRYMSVLGVVIALLGFGYAIKIYINFLQGSPIEGWSSIMVAILVLCGIQMIMLGVLGEYLWRTFDETRRRPRYIIEYTLD